MIAPRLRMRVERDGATYCGRPGCFGEFGVICELVNGRRVHVVEGRWQTAQGAGGPDEMTLYLHLPRRRHARQRRFMGQTLPDELLAIEPDAVLKCPACGAMQRLAPGSAEGCDPALRMNIRIKPDQIRARVHVDASHPSS